MFDILFIVNMTHIIYDTYHSYVFLIIYLISIRSRSILFQTPPSVIHHESVLELGEERDA